MHICLSDGWGGLEMYPARIIPELQRQGWEAHGLALAGSRVAESLAAAGCEPLTVVSRGRALLQVGRVLAYLKRHGIDVLHCHKSSDLRLGALLVTLQPRLKLFYTDHMGVTRPKKDLYHRWAYGRVTRLFAISEATRRRNLKAFPLPAARIHRLYLGIDLAPYAPQLDRASRELLRRELDVAPDQVAIGLPGRLTDGKGHEVWLEGLARLRERAPGLAWHGVLIGGLTASEGSDEAYVAQLRKRVAALGLEGRVTFAGYRPDLPRLFEALDIVCVPSRNEAFGLTVVEAMAAGKAVVGADSGAIPELLEADCGRLAAPEEPQAWAEAMAELGQDAALRRRLGQAARCRAERHFAVAAHVRALTEEYAGA
ncbi:glycosyltransferase family 4 protein [Halomonas sp. MCCC 1A17488]|uniref:Glycosyltransferase family 4 protein n=2 Tax=Oceanospirillales TaxID=135619 RepID=A0ABX7W983_9GAMM|nr:glycosyltransferase family 4 protein [Halomonas sp. MCCC 1A17488]MCG3240577.1 glycosyltransferase family 4 protein [Halomonas sp. MCCC 1A17488]QPP51458.1 glycosyltransferase family 4 protein [Halomonas sp. SS10-MC5]QTP56916.1 glycosyltransferase family 4 protein [Halomonas sulfidoxydans]